MTFAVLIPERMILIPVNRDVDSKPTVARFTHKVSYRPGDLKWGSYEKRPDY